jgi:hypothetical protein
MTHTNQTALDIDKLEAMVRSGAYITRTEKLALIQLARRAQPSEGFKPEYKSILDHKGKVVGVQMTNADQMPPASAASAGSERPADSRAYDEACNVAKAIYSQHYREGTEDWRVLPDLRGVISQISNMVAGMTRTDRVHRLAAPSSSASEQDEQTLRGMFQRDAQAFLGSPMVAYAPGFQKDDDGGYMYAATRSLFSFWKAARAAHQAATNPTSGDISQSAPISTPAGGPAKDEKAAAANAGGLPHWRDALRWSKANTDYHGLIAFTPGQLEHFVSMLTGGWLPAQANKPGDLCADLSPCPLCGCCAVRIKTDPTNAKRHNIKCEDCPAGAEFHSSDRQQAVDAWNRRAAATSAVNLDEATIIKLAKRAGFTFTRILSKGPELMAGNAEAHHRLLQFADLLTARATAVGTGEQGGAA